MKSPSFSLVLGLFALTAVVACSQPNTTWVKSGASVDDLHAAQRDCASTASGYDFVDAQTYGGMERERASSAASNEYRRCMEGQGWTRQRIDQQKPK